MNTEAALALWRMSYAANDIEAQERAAEASALGATSDQIDEHWTKRQQLDAASTQTIGGQP